MALYLLYVVRTVSKYFHSSSNESSHEQLLYLTITNVYNGVMNQLTTKQLSIHNSKPLNATISIREIEDRAIKRAKNSTFVSYKRQIVNKNGWIVYILLLRLFAIKLCTTLLSCQRLDLNRVHKCCLVFCLLVGSTNLVPY